MLNFLRVVVAFLWEVTKRVIDLLKVVVPVVWKVVVVILKAMVYTAMIMWSSLRPEIAKIADAIEYNLSEHVPLNLHDYLHRFCVALATFAMILSWICLSFATVWIVEWILGRMI